MLILADFSTILLVFVYVNILNELVFTAKI